MIALFAHIPEVSLATAFGVAGLSAQLVWPLFRGRETILTIQLAAACSYAASYSMMGQATAAALCLTGALQTAIALLASDRPWLSRMGYLFLPVVLTLGALTYAGTPTLLAVTACCLTMIGRMQSDTLRMRSVQLTASPFGAAHDVFVGAWPCLAGALLSFTIALSAFRREQHDRRLGAQAA
jgi:hypothetical protein